MPYQSEYYVYILTNYNDKVMYIGVTNDLRRRMYEHKNGLIEGFTSRYNVHKLVYFEHCPSIEDAIAREKQIKGWKRIRKNALVETINPKWADLTRRREFLEGKGPLLPSPVVSSESGAGDSSLRSE